MAKPYIVKTSGPFTSIARVRIGFSADTRENYTHPSIAFQREWGEGEYRTLCTLRFQQHDVVRNDISSRNVTEEQRPMWDVGAVPYSQTYGGRWDDVGVFEVEQAAAITKKVLATIREWLEDHPGHPFRDDSIFLWERALTALKIPVVIEFYTRGRTYNNVYDLPEEYRGQFAKLLREKQRENDAA